MPKIKVRTDSFTVTSQTDLKRPFLDLFVRNNGAATLVINGSAIFPGQTYTDSSSSSGQENYTLYQLSFDGVGLRSAVVIQKFELND